MINRLVLASTDCTSTAVAAVVLVLQYSAEKKKKNFVKCYEFVQTKQTKKRVLY